MEDINARNIGKFEKLVSQTRRTAIVTHMKPDGDAVGSCVALYHYLSRCCKADIRIILNDPCPSYLEFLTEGIPAGSIIIHTERPAEAETAISDCDLIFCLDFNAFHRADRLEASLKASRADKVLIDHHLNPDREVFDLTFSETDISSASELLYHILMETGPIAHDASALPQSCATALMTGMTTDTNNFANSTFPSTFRMASALLAAGTDRDRILSCLYNQYRESRLRILGHMMKDLMTITKDGVAYIVLDKETLEKYDVREGDTEGFVNMPLTIADVRMSLLLKEEDGKARVSIRSKKGTSANRCAVRYFNGGGHENAAGGRLDIPGDISGIHEAAAYIEEKTNIFLNGKNEDKE